MVTYKVMYYYSGRTTYKVLCLGWYKIGRRSQGLPTHNVNSSTFSSVLVHHVVSLVITIFLPLLTYLVIEGNPCLMLMSCLILLTMLIKGALKHHTYGDFKPTHKWHFVIEALYHRV